MCSWASCDEGQLTRVQTAAVQHRLNVCAHTACCARKSLVGRLGANQVIEGRKRRLGAFAHGDDDLLVRHGGAVARSKHAGRAGGAFGVNHDFAEGVALQRV